MLKLVGSFAAGQAANSALGYLSSIPLLNAVKNGKKDAKMVASLMRDSLAKGDVSSDKIFKLEDINPHFKGMTNAMFLPSLKKVFSSDNLRDNPDIISHELGHASNFNSKHWLRKLTSATYGLGKMAPMAAMLGNLLGHSKLTTGQQMGINALSSLLYSPVLVEEFSASNKGRKMMKNKGINSLGSFAGIPTYFAYGLTPYVQTLSQHLFGVNKQASYRPGIYQRY